jgi:glycosyltransferase involved in cell wall biosynthesis
MAAWRLIDVSESNGNKIDLCIATKYPTYLAQHPNKVTWLVHQHRVFYDLEDSEFDVPHHSAEDQMVRKKVRSTDARFLNESKAIYSISHTVSDRLQHYNGLASTPIYPPPELAGKIRPGAYGDYILYIGRVERIKRIEPLIYALAAVPRVKAVIVGTGEHLAQLKEYAAAQGVMHRCHFEGYVVDERYLTLLAGARAIYYAPLDEDFGFATIEAMLARKPVLTLSDSGEVARIVESTQGGFVAKSQTDELITHLSTVMAMSDKDINERVDNAHAFAATITWDNVLDQLVVPHL